MKTLEFEEKLGLRVVWDYACVESVFSLLRCKSAFSALRISVQVAMCWYITTVGRVVAWNRLVKLRYQIVVDPLRFHAVACFSLLFCLQHYHDRSHVVSLLPLDCSPPDAPRVCTIRRASVPRSGDNSFSAIGCRAPCQPETHEPESA